MLSIPPSSALFSLRGLDAHISSLAALVVQFMLLQSETVTSVECCPMKHTWERHEMSKARCERQRHTCCCQKDLYMSRMYYWHR